MWVGCTVSFFLALKNYRADGGGEGRRCGACSSLSVCVPPLLFGPRRRERLVGEQMGNRREMYHVGKQIFLRPVGGFQLHLQDTMLASQQACGNKGSIPFWAFGPELWCS